ncbi:hypothetical protein RJT34_13214 [Clitoria ternatea]|uniref:Uncharacterized protein n=1 Tax=Clitoria ternatea TaxID=43366 RepID=A0AAN9PM34_CLITE
MNNQKVQNVTKVEGGHGYTPVLIYIMNYWIGNKSALLRKHMNVNPLRKTLYKVDIINIVHMKEIAQLTCECEHTLSHYWHAIWWNGSGECTGRANPDQSILYECSDEHSWKKSRDLLEKVARQGDLTGYRVPCLLIAAKDDLTPYPRAVQDSVKVTRELGIQAPSHLSMKLGDSIGTAMEVVGLAACRAYAARKNSSG